MRHLLPVLFVSTAVLAQRAGDVAMLSDGKLHVILCGTGSPLPDPERAGSCTAIIAGGQVILVDIGPGSWRKAMVANVPGQALSAVLLTHFHSDHIGDLGEAMTMSWTNGRSAALDVYGPVGVEKVVRGFTDAYDLDAEYRILHHGEAIMPAKAHGMVAHTVELPDRGERRRVFEKNGVTVCVSRGSPPDRSSLWLSHRIRRAIRRRFRRYFILRQSGAERGRS